MTLLLCILVSIITSVITVYVTDQMYLRRAMEEVGEHDEPSS